MPIVARRNSDVVIRPFFRYFGSKWNLAPCYPPPRHSTIIEAFAGSACYSLYYSHLNVVLYDVDSYVYSVWNYLINVKESEIRSLPSKVEHIDDVKCCSEAKLLIGYWFNTDGSPLHVRPSSFTKVKGWSSRVRDRIASNLRYIRHWKVFKESYKRIPNIPATWFIDPPYQHVHGYRCNNILYDRLADWCQSRIGQVIVCEQEPAKWLPFEKFNVLRGQSKNKITGKKHINQELIWTNDE